MRSAMTNMHIFSILQIVVSKEYAKFTGNVSKIAKKTAVFPFGSDLLRCKSKNEKAAKDFLEQVGVIATVTPAMKDVLLKRFKVDNSKLREWIMGNDFIDKYVEQSH